MTIDPVWLNARTALAVQSFWDARAAAKRKQALNGSADVGGRASVTGGQTMDGFVDLFAEIVDLAGMHDAQVFRTRSRTTLPGFFRPYKDWDLVVLRRGVLVASLELKSHVGPSFGNNFNNRIEEAIGSSLDLWTAYREGAFGVDQPRPFLGWLIHVEDAFGSRKTVGDLSRNFPSDDEMLRTSYIDRYRIFCQRLLMERLYAATGVIASTEHDGARGVFTDEGAHNSMLRFAVAFSTHISNELMLNP